MTRKKYKQLDLILHILVFMILGVTMYFVYIVGSAEYPIAKNNIILSILGLAILVFRQTIIFFRKKHLKYIEDNYSLLKDVLDVRYKGIYVGAEMVICKNYREIFPYFFMTERTDILSDEYFSNLDEFAGQRIKIIKIPNRFNLEESYYLYEDPLRTPVTIVIQKISEDYYNGIENSPILENITLQIPLKILRWPRKTDPEYGCLARVQMKKLIESNKYNKYKLRTGVYIREEV